MPKGTPGDGDLVGEETGEETFGRFGPARWRYRVLTERGNRRAGQVLQMMEEHRICRLPVTGNHRLAGLAGEADLARHRPGRSIAGFVERVYAGSWPAGHSGVNRGGAA